MNGDLLSTLLHSLLLTYELAAFRRAYKHSQVIQEDLSMTPFIGLTTLLSGAR